MPGISQMSAVQLRELCESKGLLKKDHDRLTRKQMIELLKNAESGNDQTDGPAGDDQAADDASEIADNNSNADESQIDFDDDADGGSESISLKPPTKADKP